VSQHFLKTSNLCKTEVNSYLRGLYDKNINNFLRPYEEKNCRATAPGSRGNLRMLPEKSSKEGVTLHYTWRVMAFS